MTDPGAFDMCGPLPEGVTVLEASAGTGKTFTIAALAARYVADGVPLERMLAVTFTRMATGELRDRVRQRLVSAAAGLAAVARGEPVDPDDAVLAVLADGPAGEVHRRRRRLEAALRDFDAATITTTHGLCHRVLAGLGGGGDIDPTTPVAEDAADVLAEVLDDAYVRRTLRGAVVPFSRDEAARVARVVTANPSVPIDAVDLDESRPEWVRWLLADVVRKNFARRKRRAGVVTYDDLVTRLDEVLRDDDMRRRLAGRFDVVLVDEFQDTDTQQWDILRAAFATCRALVLIGDPKQAIYAFRGADVAAYLAAVAEAGRARTLAVNWRSDQALLDALDALWGDADLGDPRIVYRRVRAAAHHRQPGIDAPGRPGALRWRVLRRDHPGLGLARGVARKGPARALVTADVAAEVAGLLSCGATLRGSPDGDRPLSSPAGGDRPLSSPAGGDRPLRPGDLAVLCRRHATARSCHAALCDAGVPAVLNGADSVFGTEPARAWLTLLEALERPSDPSRVHAAALTPFVGWTAPAVAAAGDGDWEDLHTTFHQWAAVARTAGVASLAELVTRTTGMPARLLGEVGGERRLTDLRHVAELLHAEALAGRLGTAALTGWLRRRIREAASETPSEERARRLESDAAAVQIMTIHASKGLEFPVVLYPDLWDVAPAGQDDDPVVFHDGEGRRRIDVAGRGRSFEEHRRAQQHEQRGEDLRLAYVALTRARHQAVVWWVGANESRHSPLERLVFARSPDGAVAPEGVPTRADDAVIAALSGLGEACGGALRVETVGDGPAGATAGPPPSGPGTDAALAAAAFVRPIDGTWRRTSYTGLTAEAHDATAPTVGSEPEETALADDDRVDDDGMPTAANGPAGPLDPDEARLRAVPSPLRELPGGARIGTLVHRVLETVDFADPDLPGAVGDALAGARARWPVPVGDPATVTAGLVAALTTPLASLTDDTPLAGIAAADRLDELGFELPVAGGDRPDGGVDLAAVADLLADRLGPDDPLAAYPPRLREPSVAGVVRGYLTGSLDLVIRRTGPDGAARFAVVDYKTNVLADRADLSAWDYRPAALAEAMIRAHYPLQALFYSVALHRYLRWRIPAYDPRRHLGGVGYLFLRGMCGPDTPRVGGQRCGVFAWHPDPGLVTDLSDLIDRGGTGRVGP